MKILQICNKVPYPAKDGGAIAMLNLSTSFAELGHDLTILAMNTPKHSTSLDEIPEDLKKKIDFNLVFVDTRIRPFALLLNLFFSRKPYNALRFINDRFKRSLLELLRKKEFDIIQLEGLYLTSYIPLIRKCCTSIIALRTHNIESEIWSRIKSLSSNVFKGYYFGILSRRLEKLEMSTLNTYDLLIPITERDAAAFNEMGNKKPFKVIPAGVAEQYFNSNNSNAGSSKKLFFIGALDWIPNQEGLLWFFEKVWNHLTKTIPEIEFHVAGRNAPDWLKKRCIEYGVIFHGEIDDAHRFMDSKGIMVVPLFAGSGMRIKIIEAMARSKIVVSSTIGAEGLGVEDGMEIIIGNNENEFISGITRLLMEENFFGRIQENAFVYTKQNFNNKQLTSELIGFYKKHLT